MTTPTTREPELCINVLPLLRRRWACGVVRSGFHNGAGCRPGDPHHHEDWGCGWRFELSVADTPDNRSLLGIDDETARRLT